MRKIFDCSDWFYEDGRVIGKVSIKDSKPLFQLLFRNSKLDR